MYQSFNDYYNELVKISYSLSHPQALDRVIVHLHSHGSSLTVTRNGSQLP